MYYFEIWPINIIYIANENGMCLCILYCNVMMSCFTFYALHLPSSLFSPFDFMRNNSRWDILDVYGYFFVCVCILWHQKWLLQADSFVIKVLFCYCRIFFWVQMGGYWILFMVICYWGARWIGSDVFGHFYWVFWEKS